MDPEFKERIDAVNDATSWSTLGFFKEKGTVDCPICLRKGKAYLYDNFFKCFSSRCQAKGDKITLHSKLKNIKWFDALLELEKGANIDPAKQLEDYEKRNALMLDVLAAYNDQIYNHPEVLKYLFSRGFEEEFIDIMCIGYAPHNSVLSVYENISKNALYRNSLATPKKEFYWDHVIFPIFCEQKKLVHFTGRHFNHKNGKEFKYLDTPAIPVIGPSKKYLLFEDQISYYKAWSDTIYLVEGVADSFTLRQLGWPVVGIQGLAKLMSHAEKFRGFKKLVAMFDNDIFDNSHPYYAGEYKSWRVIDSQLIDLQIYFGEELIIDKFMPPNKFKEVKDINDLYLHVNRDNDYLKEIISNYKVNLVKDFILRHRSDISQHKTAIKLVGATNSYKDLMEDYMFQEMSRIDYVTRLLSY